MSGTPSAELQQRLLPRPRHGAKHISAPPNDDPRNRRVECAARPGSSSGERLLEREGREQLGAVCGEKNLLFELDSLPTGWLADVAFNTDRHVLRECAVVAEGV